MILTVFLKLKKLFTIYLTYLKIIFIISNKSISTEIITEKFCIVYTYFYSKLLNNCFLINVIILMS